MTATATEPSFLSRERLAGYEPDALDAARIVVVGAGATGQNLVLALALSGVRTLVVVDPDAFEDSNRTRSPFYRAGAPKARAVAEGFLRTASHPEPEAYFHVGLVQEVGDLLAGGLTAEWSPTAIVSAVDSNRARAYLAQLCRRFAVPLVEAGFDGADIGVSVVSNNREVVGEACWACGRRTLQDASVRGLCSLYARQAEEAGFTPAIQSAAQLAGAVVAETAIGFAHVRASSPEEEEPELRRRVPLAGHRWHLNVRTGRSVLARLALDPDCAVDHAHLDPADLLATINAPGTVGELLLAVEREVGPGAKIGLLDPVAISMPCRSCGRALRVGLPLSAVSTAPTCANGECSPVATPARIEVRERVTAADLDLLGLPLRGLCLGPGSVFYASGERDTGLIQLHGTVPTVLSRATLSTTET